MAQLCGSSFSTLPYYLHTQNLVMSAYWQVLVARWHPRDIEHALADWTFGRVGSEENSVDETWVVILHSSCTFTVSEVITQIETELAATNTSDLMSGNRRSRHNRKSTHNPRALTIHEALTIQGARQRVATQAALFEISKRTRMQGFTFVCPVEALASVLEHDCVKYVRQDFSETVDDIPERNEDVLAGGLELIDGSHDVRMRSWTSKPQLSKRQARQ